MNRKKWWILFTDQLGGGGAGGRAAKSSFLHTRPTKPAWMCDLHQQQCIRAKSHLLPATTAYVSHLRLVAGAENKGSFAKMVSCQQATSFTNLWAQFLEALRKANMEKTLIVRFTIFVQAGSRQTSRQSLHVKH